MRDHVDHIDVEVAADGLEVVADVVHVVGVRCLQIDGTGGEVTGRPDQFVGVTGGQQEPSLVEQIPGSDVGGAAVAVDQDDRGPADRGDSVPMRRAVDSLIATESAHRLPGTGSPSIQRDRKV